MHDSDSDFGMKIYLRDIGQVPLLTPAEEIQLAFRIKEGDAVARSLMIRANLRLVVKIAREFTNMGLPLLDLISEGNIGLVKGVERFDPAKGCKLSTYACWWIRQAIRRALSNKSHTVRLPVYFAARASRARRTTQWMTGRLGRLPTDDELAAELGIESSKVSQLRSLPNRAVSLDASISADDPTKLVETIRDENAPTPFEFLRDKNLQIEVDKLLMLLDDREREIILRRFGLDGGRPQTLQEIGHELSLTRERIRQLQNIALQRLRAGLYNKDGLGKPSD